MHLLLQWLGGGFYLLNKVFLSFTERAQKSGRSDAARRWRIAAWAIYLAGLPPWVIIFISWNNWIAAFVEASGTPAMILGLMNAFRGTSKGQPEWLRHLSRMCIVLGFACSFYDLGVLKQQSQWLEVGLVAGFLLGTNDLKDRRRRGYLWFVLMHVSCGWLMWIQGYPWLFAQQVVSLAFIWDAYRTSKRAEAAQ